MAWMPKQAAVGEIIHWYQGGSLSNNPIPAIVVKVDNTDMVSINLFQENMPTMQNLYGVPHLDNPMEGVNPEYVIEKGAWCRPTDNTPQYEQATLERMNFINHWRLQGKNDHEIAEALGPYWDSARVAEVVPHAHPEPEPEPVAKPARRARPQPAAAK